MSSLDAGIKAEIQGAYSQFLSSKDYKPRYGQRLMIAHIARSLGSIGLDAEGRRQSGKPLCVVEAGTGVGKTLAYILAAVPVARALDKTLVVSTATVALQEQIILRDLPDIVRHSGLKVSYALAKGRRRYVCLSKLDQQLSGSVQQSALLYPDEMAASSDEQSIKLFQSMAEALAYNKWDGDMDLWPDALSTEQKLAVTTDNAQCTGRRCSHVKQCAFFQAREEMGECEVIVANHDLVLADLSLGGGAILPEPEDCIYVFDEAHHLPDKVIQHFSHHLRLGATERWLDQSDKAYSSILSMSGISGSLRASIESLMVSAGLGREALQAAQPMMARLEESLGEYEQRLRFSEGLVPGDLAALAKQAAEHFGKLAFDADLLRDTLQKLIDERELELPRETLEEWLGFVAAYCQRAESAAGLWRSYAQTEAADGPPLARWIQWQDSGVGQVDVELCSSPILAADSLVDELWSRCFGAVLTSATLTAMGGFERFNMRTGAESLAHYEVVPSPFRYAEAAELHIPDIGCDAGQADAHTEALIEQLPKMLDKDSGSLVLFSSRRQMEAVFDGLPLSWRQRILRQDSASKHELLSKHKAKVAKGEGSVLFGLASFAEGIDLPGKECSHVVIAKIPFAVPDDPVEEALSEWIEKNKGNPFMEVSVPDAAIRLVQACGRLLRSESDTGRISIMDSRLLSRRYGQRMLDSLPPYKRMF